MNCVEEKYLEEYADLFVGFAKDFYTSMIRYKFTTDYLRRLVICLEDNGDYSFGRLFEEYANILNEIGSDYKKLMELIISLKLIIITYSERDIEALVEQSSLKGSWVGIKWLGDRYERIMREAEEYLLKSIEYYQSIFEGDSEALHYFDCYI